MSLSSMSARPPSDIQGATAVDAAPGHSTALYSSLKPCSHISQVLSTSAKDTVLRNYALAVRVAKLNVIPSQNLPKYKSPKGAKGQTDKQMILRLKNKALRCKDCHDGIDGTFMCLQCPHVGCWHKSHFISHAKLQGHIFGIDGQTGYLFCFKCGDYTAGPLLESTRLAVMGPKDPLESKESQPDEEELIEKYTRSTNFKPTTGLRGFVNMGATCFMSSVLQTFLHNPIIRDYFMTEGHMDCTKRKDECISCCLDEMFTEFYTSNKTSGYGPVNLLTAAWRANKSLAGYSEQDAHEFWQFMVNQVHKGLTTSASMSSSSSFTSSSHSSSTASSTSSTASSNNSGHSSCPCILHQTFSSDLQSSITCTKCDTVRDTIDPIIDISLEITHSQDLVSCLHNFTRLEKLDIKYNCATCGHRTPATKKLSFKKFPNTLAIQLKRFEHNAQSFKLENYVSFPMFLNMTEFSTDYEHTRQMDPSLTYELYAVVCHIGSVNTGHYIVVVKNNQGQWFKFDDSVVTTMTVEQVSQLKAYLLFYIVHKMG